MDRFDQVGSIRFLVGNHLDRISQVVCKPEDSPSGLNLDAETMLLFAYTREIVSSDDQWTGDMEAIAALREKGAGKDEVQEDFNLKMRFKEIGAIVSSLVRKGILMRTPTPVTEWNPDTTPR